MSDVTALQRRRRGTVTIHPDVRKIAISLATGGLSIAAGTLADASAADSILIGLMIGGITFVVQHLIDFSDVLERTIETIAREIDELPQTTDEKLDSVDRAARLIEDVDQAEASMGAPGGSVSVLLELMKSLNGCPPLAKRLAAEETQALGILLTGLSNGKVDYPAEDRDWLLALTRRTEGQIRAISTVAGDGGARSFARGFWSSQLGLSYLTAQRDAAQRNVVVRRIFVLQGVRAIESRDFLQTCLNHRHHGVDVRAISIQHAMEISRVNGAARPTMEDFILFDDEISYETAAGVNGLTTVLCSGADHILRRTSLFESLWAEAVTPDVQCFGDESSGAAGLRVGSGKVGHVGVDEGEGVAGGGSGGGEDGDGLVGELAGPIGGFGGEVGGGGVAGDAVNGSNDRK